MANIEGFCEILFAQLQTLMSRQRNLFVSISYDYFYITRLPSFAVPETHTVLLSHQGICISDKKQSLNLSHSLLWGLTNLSSVTSGRYMKTSLLILKLPSSIRHWGTHVYHRKLMLSTAIGTYFDDEGCEVPMDSHQFIPMMFEALDIITFLLLNMESPTTTSQSGLASSETSLGFRY